MRRIGSIPARTAFGRQRVLHIHDKERTGQHRGKPLLTSIVPMFKMLDHYERSGLPSRRGQCHDRCNIETPLDGEAIGEMFGGSVDDYLAARNEFGIFACRAVPSSLCSQATRSHRSRQAARTAVTASLSRTSCATSALANIPFELLMKDFSKTNYSSPRGITGGVAVFQRSPPMDGDLLGQAVYELWLEEAINRGIVDAPDFMSAARHGRVVNGSALAVVGLIRSRKPKPRSFACRSAYPRWKMNVPARSGLGRSSRTARA